MTYVYPMSALNDSRNAIVNRAIVAGTAAWLLVFVAAIVRAPDGWIDAGPPVRATERTVYEPPLMVSIESIGSTREPSSNDLPLTDDHP